MSKLGLLLSQLFFELLHSGLCLGQGLSGSGQVHVKVLVLCGEALHLLVLCLKVEQRRERKTGKQRAKEVMESDKECIRPVLAEIQLEGWMVLWSLGKGQGYTRHTGQCM